jgi:hypothetical protein
MWLGSANTPELFHARLNDQPIQFLFDVFATEAYTWGEGGTLAHRSGEGESWNHTVWTSASRAGGSFRNQITAIFELPGRFWGDRRNPLELAWGSTRLWILLVAQ